MLKTYSHIIFAYLSLAFIFSTQASAISEKKCRSNDWFAVGREFGFKGEAEDKILKDQEACKKRGVEISLVEYKKGWQMGISQYCSADNAYKLGFSKKKPTKNCPLEMKPHFDQFFTWGKEASQVQRDIKKSENDLKKKKKDLSKAQNRVKKLESEVEKLTKRTQGLKDKVASIEKEMSQKRLKPEPKPVGVQSAE